MYKEMQNSINVLTKKYKMNHDFWCCLLYSQGTFAALCTTGAGGSNLLHGSSVASLTVYTDSHGIHFLKSIIVGPING